jgi:hypothetical protein
MPRHLIINNYCLRVRSRPSFPGVTCFNIFQYRQTGPQECSTTISEEDNRDMEKTVAAVNLARRQTSTYDFGVYFSVVAANTTEAGGWVPYVHVSPFLFSYLFLQAKANRRPDHSTERQTCGNRNRCQFPSIERFKDHQCNLV